MVQRYTIICGGRISKQQKENQASSQRGEREGKRGREGRREGERGREGRREGEREREKEKERERERTV